MEKEILPNTLPIVRRLLRFDKDVVRRRNKENQQPNNKIEEALSFIFAENDALFEAIYKLILDNNLRSSGILLRSLLESTANAHWITSKDVEERAEKYCGTIENYTNHMADISPGLISASRDIRIPKSVTDWTDSSADDRIAHLSPYAPIIWDYLSPFTHVSPSFLSHGLVPGRFLTLAYFLVDQALSYALTTRMLIVQNSQVFNEAEMRRISKLTEDYINLQASRGNKTLEAGFKDAQPV
jgi:hypothetical protein